MELLCPIVGKLVGNMDRFRDHFSMGNRIAAQLIGHDLSGLTTMRLDQPPEEVFCRSTIPLRLQKYIKHFAIPKA